MADLTAAEMARQLFVTERSVRRYTSADRRPDESIVAKWETICGLEAGALVQMHAALPARAGSPLAAHADEASREVQSGRPAAPAARRREGGPRGWQGGAMLAWGVVAVLVTGFAGYLSGQLSTLGGVAARQEGPAPTDARTAKRADAGAYGLTLERVFAALDEARVHARRSLAAASTAEAQAAAAGQVATAYARAISALRLRGTPSDERAGRFLLRALRAAYTAYDRLAIAARVGRPREYRRASALVLRAERRMRAALGRSGIEPHAAG